MKSTTWMWLLTITLCAPLAACADDSSGGGSGQGGSGQGGSGEGAGAQGGTGQGGSGSGAGGQGGSTTSGSGGSTSGLDCSLAWSSGFETGFPGEFLNYDNGSWSANGGMPPGNVSAWTIVDGASGEPVYEGDHAYKGWIVAPAGESHRAYPVLHTDLATPLVNTFMVYLEADYNQMNASEWIHFGTWGNDDGNGNGKWALHTMAVRDRHLEFAHTDPFSGEYIGPEPQPEFPTGQWVRFTVYLHYQGGSGFVQAWQDGVAVLRADVAELANFPGTVLTRAHWGMYASAETSQGVQYNDSIGLWTLSAPLSDLSAEPDCYLDGI